MSKENCMKCLKWFVFVLNFLFWLSGLGMLAVGLWLRFDPDVASFMDLHGSLDDFYVGCYILIAVGIIMSLLGFLGCCGALRESQCMLTSFFVLLLVVFCVLFAGGFLAYTHQDQVKTYIEDSMRDTVRVEYTRQAAHRKVMDRIQNGLECCGVDDYLDWLKSSFTTQVEEDHTELGLHSTIGRVPKSCCNTKGLSEFGTKCGKSFDTREVPGCGNELRCFKQYVHNRGCLDSLYQKFYNNLDIIIGISIGIGAFMLIGMVLTMSLCCWIGHNKEEDEKTGGYYYN